MIQVREEQFDRKPFYVMLFSVGCLVFGLWWHPAVLAALLVQAAYIVVSPDERIAQLLFFMLPFASIYKLSAGTISLFTLLEILALAVLICRRNACNYWVLVMSAFFALYMLCQPNRDYLSMIKLLLVVLLFYYLGESCTGHPKKITLSFSAGLILSSALGLLRERLPALALYVEDVYSYSAEGEIARFTGLYSDPNYYSINLIVCKFALLFLYRRQRIGKLFWVLSAALSVCILLTFSKSSILMYALYLCVLCWVLLSSGRFGWGALILLFFAAGLCIIFFSDFQYFVLLRARFMSKNLSELTTGRSSLLESYWRYISDNGIRIAFGSGTGQELLHIRGQNRAAHNTYVDLLYYFGAIGGTLLVGIIGTIFGVMHRRQRRDLTQYMPVLSILVMYFFLSALLSIDLPFQLILAAIILNEGEEDNEVEQKAYHFA